MKRLVIYFCLLSANVTIAQLTEAELMDTLQKDVFKYFWEYKHPNANLSRERLHEDNVSFDENTIAIGGSGFGLLNIILGIENSFITPSEGVNHLYTALDFLENADRFHGAWSHWIDGNTGQVISFSTFDDGGDLVETALLCQSLICIREYFKDGNTQEQILAQKADALWKGVEWSWYTKNENVLYWHWSPNYDWQMNFPIRGYNEALITYLLAVSSPDYPVSTNVYHEGWARDGDIVSSSSQYNIPVLLNHNSAPETVGPLFWAHYSYLALDPRCRTTCFSKTQQIIIKRLRSWQAVLAQRAKVKGVPLDVRCICCTTNGETPQPTPVAQAQLATSSYVFCRFVTRI